ncbi:2-polyprenyl-6-methoxyphenol hydroxylase-like FAD-dependent oxidoreductase [Streptomyces sp. T12]|uniref:FAD-dependent monooxygenase n=1 Tax=Streptomyces sp. T12 TaxID=477697 RepID=UPI0011A680AA|nr:FAD-dependent monooxygenase [Streptomyces sp. T12]TWD14043.1 2-polyprenyl-6-methoxyphenol hydroxylase-like FAD-dependent oxidoreductase [Streptomyces sp. T12]
MTGPRTVLISGASVSGPALAYWLHRAGFAVTVVEKADALRGGGYPVDIRGTATEVIRRTGLWPRLREAHIGPRRATFLDAAGRTVASLRATPDEGEPRDLEIRRGDLADALYGLVRDDVEFLFGDRVSRFDPAAHGVDVTFRSGGQATYDLVIGADGMHSATRAALFGPEDRFHRYLGYCFALFTLPNPGHLHRELVLWNTPGKAAALYAVGDAPEVHGFLTFHRPEPPHDALRDPGAQRDLVASVFADEGWEVPRLVAALCDADDLFFDTAGQIRMPHWSRGRVALVGDAAYAPSFLTGQGTSLALSGAYVLAHALAAHRDPTAAFAAYERGMRPYVTANQALVDQGGATLFPTTERALEQRNARLRTLGTMPSAPSRPAHTALTLPDYDGPAAPSSGVTRARPVR